MSQWCETCRTTHLASCPRAFDHLPSGAELRERKTMTEIPKIGKASDVWEIQKDLYNAEDIEELIVIRAYRGSDGLEFRYDYTRSMSRFRMAGVLLWVANQLLGAIHD